MSLKVDHIAFLVESLEISLPYYTKLFDLIGFNQLRPGVWSDTQGFMIQFNQAKKGTNKYERYSAGMNHIGFSAPSANFLIEVQTQMRKSGFIAPEIQSFGAAKALFMKDPDGIRFEITYDPSEVIS